MFSSISTAPPKQSASETITVLSGRLNSATLLEDRRAAILGLRSFAKDFPASVASGALRSLIGSLSKDSEDLDTLKVVLETLLMLFNPNESSPEASDEVALWLADEFTQRQENITLLLDLLDSTDFYSRLYSLQLLVAILAARPERTEECIFTAPLGISRLVAVLDDGREAVRGEAISLLTYLTPNSPDLQKLVAFESAYERLFSIVNIEGGLTDGGRVVEDCLILMANLLRQNPSNQTLFRESGLMSKLSLLIETTSQSEAEAELAGWVLSQRNRNLYALLAVVRLFLVPGAVGTPQNQLAFRQHGLLNHALQLSFNPTTQNQIKAEAMATCADIIRGNNTLQEGFAQLTVLSPFPPPPSNNPEAPTPWPQVYVIDGLLDLTLGMSALADFDLRFTACECLKAYFYGHSQIRSHFLSRAINGHKAGHDETANVLSILLNPVPSDVAASDPYRIWFSATIAFHLLYNNPAAKAQAMELTEGEAEHGEEVVTAIQTVTAHLISGLHRSDEPRILTAYLMLLIAWLYEDLDAVNDFLNEGSNVQGLIQAVVQPRGVDEIVQGLCAMLLGVVYEFSTKDSSISRASLHSILLSRMGQEKFSDRLSRLRSHPFMRDYEVIPQKLDPSSGLLPDVFFDRTFVEFFKDTYSRVSRALDRDPNMEVSVISNGVQKGISRELVDSLRDEVSEKERLLEESRNKLASMESALQKEQSEHRKTRDTSSVETTRMKTVNEALQRQNEIDLKKATAQYQQQLEAEKQKINQVYTEYEIKTREITAQHTAQLESEKQRAAQAYRELEAKSREVASQHAAQLEEALKKMEELEQQHSQKLREAEAAQKAMQADFQQQLSQTKSAQQIMQADFQHQLSKIKATSESETERVKGRLEAKIADLNATCSRFEVDLMKAQRERKQELQTMQAKYDEDTKAAEQKLEEEQARAQKAEAQVKALEDKIKDLEKQLEDMELDDLLMVFGDLEEKVSGYKKRLVAHGEAVSDVEDDGDDGDDDE
ncbi:hypothetical protein TD95_004754 [Thielaviopsis punctulata]|uniref:Vesicle tethering protein Uso1/P115-like head domain-containing protein n=1 Tax=Thielaviopsis punctulata TaxID=72032 RepID=A0A0F4ZDK6_9PEZI|nr:hypothetical protein TD95_004754 [Thielaviopsis punctulata]